jgi:lysophospholipase L1-like esterase
MLESQLNQNGRRVRLIEDCLNGRRTVWDDRFKPGRNGLQGLAQRIEINSPLALVILMLGTNDFQNPHEYNDAWAAAQGIAALVREIRQAPIEPGTPVPGILYRGALRRSACRKGPSPPSSRDRSSAAWGWPMRTVS